VWPDRLPKSWERDLSAVVSKLRSLLMSVGFDEPVRSAMGCYQLRLGSHTTVDVFDAMRFVEDAEAAMARGELREAHAAIAVAHEHCLRPFLPGESTQWVEARRAERRLLLVRVLDAIVEIDTRRGVFPEARRMALQLIDLEPYRESSYAGLMRLQIAAGDRADALKTYERARTLLAEELGVPPGVALEAAYDEALLADAPQGRALTTGASLPTGVVTVMFTDLVQSTELAQRLGTEKAEVLRRSHFALLRELVAMHGGHEVKSLGDGLMVVFSSATDAVKCAVAIQQAIARDIGDEPIAVRIGVHAGEPVLENGDYFGLCVVIAKRLCDAFEGGGILTSDIVRSLAAVADLQESRVELNLKGLADSTVAWHITA
jgi:class 3 adenylate cyclase